MGPRPAVAEELARGRDITYSHPLGGVQTRREPCAGPKGYNTSCGAGGFDGLDDPAARLWATLDAQHRNW
jgi:hypothetical protein